MTYKSIEYKRVSEDDGGGWNIKILYDDGSSMTLHAKGTCELHQIIEDLGI